MKNKFHETQNNHTPVLVEELLSFIPNSFQTFLDCTFGRGGHSLAFFKQFPSLKIYALDQDEDAIQYGQSLNQIPESQIQFFHSSFHNCPPEVSSKNFDVILLDLGVSSPQLEQAHRGFSFYQDGPLDMRMDQRQNYTAAHIVNESSKEDLIDLFKTYGEIRNPYKVVETIFRERKKKRIETTKELANMVLKHISWNSTRRHPATPYFLALRLKVNNELNGLKEALPALISLLNPQGCIMVITFHSLEDRIVKEIFKDSVNEKLGFLGNKKVIRPSQEERGRNVRSRSAKLRVFIKHIESN